MITKVTIRGKVIRVPPANTKAEVARWLLGQHFTVSEISKAVPMAYSQVHSIWEKVGQAARKRHPQSDDLVNGSRQQVLTGGHPPAMRRAKNVTPASSAWGKLPNTRQSTKPQKAKTLSSPRVGKLRTPGLPSDIDVGSCANCNHDLVVRGGPTGYVIIHVNTTAEEYLAVTQFCKAVPKALIV